MPVDEPMSGQQLIQITYTSTNNSSGYELVPVSVMRKVAGSGGAVTDLTNTTWTFTATTIKSTPNDPYLPDYDITGTVTAPDNTQVSFISIQMATGGIGFIVTETYYDLELGAVEGTAVCFYTPSGNKVHTNISSMEQTGTFTITVSGGNSVTNSTAITRFQNYLTQVGGSSIDTLQPVNLFSTIEVQAPSTISFTIAGTTYQAEPNMTWYEWVASEYNTGNFMANTNNVFSSNHYFVCLNYNPVSSNDLIIANENYQLQTSG